MPHKTRVAIVIKEIAIIIKGLAQDGYPLDEEQFDLPDSVMTVLPAVTSADKNRPCAKTCGDGSGVGYTIMLAAGLQELLTSAVTDSGRSEVFTIILAGTAPFLYGP